MISMKVSMFYLLLVVSITITLLLVGCATPIPLYNVQYMGAVNVTSSKTAKVLLGSREDLADTSTSDIDLPISTGPDPYFRFHIRNQRAFLLALQKELVRLHIFKSTVGESSFKPADITITVIFTQTHHDVDEQVYTLHVTMKLSGGTLPLIKQYRVISSVKDSAWEKWNTTAYQGKEKAVKRLLEKLIPTIESYLKDGL